ncbi:MGDG synthase family glycosyltransferase [Sporolactobacillus terrae]|uniref:Putative glycosyltransferase YkoN n=1 Tax=Sporolactobacillus terrae TaxID=269673 RepID=A0A410DCC0_9BACL|nr:glycosyltransferase [Sporolactobacillus terrae]QAA23786.1 UDP-N-acetylglucosamine--LPS N-acetylglucosamine transferase [Sporolactobacillus terrae]QAA26757.1 UDP-N-acetylglucosamine--LPS N-acetylglucosamine transferase [Sporolactobacillus terrae]UAK15824.1 glycosyltransferase [Sporolactobacillus terrae]BBO00328.1 putative glycosyltransferase YkoN [Sporolactobacillus terrae]
MIKNILIISSNYTGHGHKSITESLSEKFDIVPDVKIHVVDGFSLGGSTLLRVGKMYGPITRNSEHLWKVIWDITSVKVPFVNHLIEMKIKNNFLDLLEKVKPDLILTVHPNFNGSVLNILEKNDIHIPFVTLIADLISISPFWADNRASYVISPTKEAKEKCIEFGVASEKIKVIGFPVRERFYQQMPKQIDHYSPNKPLNCLLMSGGEGVGHMGKMAKTLIDTFNFNITIVAGRNEKLQEHLNKTLVKKYGSEKVKIYGFTRDIQDLIASSDIAFIRSSPNVMMEAVSCNTPIVITGALPGQEAGNPMFAEKYHLAITCESMNDLVPTINELLDNNVAMLKEIKKSQQAYVDPQIPENIVNFILNIPGEDLQPAGVAHEVSLNSINYES